MTASACARSILPFKNARRVNSPGAAETAPAAKTACKTAFKTNNPPWQESSTTSSPVKLCGAAKTVATHSSRRSPSGAARVTRHITELRAGNRLKNTVADRAGPIARNANDSDAARRRRRRDCCNGLHSLSLLLVRCTCNTFSFCIIPRGEKIVTQNVGKRRKITEKKRLLYPFGDASFLFLCRSYSVKARYERITARFQTQKTPHTQSIRSFSVLKF